MKLLTIVAGVSAICGLTGLIVSVIATPPDPHRCDGYILSALATRACVIEVPDCVTKPVDIEEFYRARIHIAKECHVDIGDVDERPPPSPAPPRRQVIPRHPPEAQTAL